MKEPTYEKPSSVYVFLKSQLHHAKMNVNYSTCSVWFQTCWTNRTLIRLNGGNSDDTKGSVYPKFGLPRFSLSRVYCTVNPRRTQIHHARSSHLHN